MATSPDRWPSDNRHNAPVTDVERDRMVARLRTECTEGRISLDRFSDLIGDVFAARTRADLQPVLAAVQPEPVAATVTDVRHRRPYMHKAGQWVVAIFGESRRKGRYRLDDNTTAAAVFGDCTIDLTDASIDGDEVSINAIAVFGNVTIVVPDGIDIAVEGASIFGTRRCDVDPANVLPGAPRIVIRAWACFGDVRIRSPRVTARR